MATPSLSDAAMTAGGRIGRYFSIVTVVPTLFLVLWAYALLSSGAWTGTPNIDALRAQLGEWSVAEVTWLLLATLVLALFLHPLQFATVQLLEGYWGASRIAIGAMRLRVKRHRARLHDLEDRLDQHEGAIRSAVAARPGGSADFFMDTAKANDIIPRRVAADALRIRRERYPEGRRVMPTRLGNVLRRYEDRAGAQYGLDAILTAPHFQQVIPEPHQQYVRDTRQLLDTTVRLCFVSLLAALLTTTATLTDGLWLLVALVPYGLAYLAYRAAIAAAEEYGTAISTIIDLDRFTLYEHLGLPRPVDTAEERTVNEHLMPLLRADDHTVVLRYTRPAVPAEPAPRRPYRPLRVPIRRRGSPTGNASAPR